MATLKAGLGQRATFLLSYFTFFLPAGVLLSFLSPFLAAKGLSVQESGGLVGLLFAVKLVASPIIAYWSDQLGAHQLAKVVFMVAAVLASIGLQAFGDFAGLAVAVAVLSMARNYFQSMLEAIASDSRSRGVMLEYGNIRFVGSAAVTVGIAWMGLFGSSPSISKAAFIAILVTSAVGFCACSWGTHVAGRPEQVGTTPAVASLSSLMLVSGAAPGAGAALVGLFVSAACLIGAHGTLYSVASLHLTQMGFGRPFIVICWITAFAGEAMGFILLERMQLLSSRVFLGLVAVLGAVRWFMFANAEMASLILLAFALHAVTFAWCHGTMVVQVRQLFSERFAATGQAFYLAIAHGVGISSSAYFGARLYAQYGRTAFCLPLCLTVVGCVFWALLTLKHPLTKGRV